MNFAHYYTKLIKFLVKFHLIFLQLYTPCPFIFTTIILHQNQLRASPASFPVYSPHVANHYHNSHPKNLIPASISLKLKLKPLESPRHAPRKPISRGAATQHSTHPIALAKSPSRNLAQTTRARASSPRVCADPFSIRLQEQAGRAFKDPRAATAAVCASLCACVCALRLLPSRSRF